MPYPEKAQRRKFGLAVIVGAFFLSLVAAPVAASDADLGAIVSSYKGGAKISISIYSLSDKTTIFTHDDKESLNPASTMKVVTSVASLSVLGGHYKYKTTFTTDTISRGVIGNLYVRGVGDPSLVEERLWRIGKDLRVRGVKEVGGDIVVDNSFFDNDDFEGKISDSSRAYNAAVSAFAINFNSFAVVASNVGGAVNVEVDPPTEYFVLNANVRSGGNSLSVTRDYRDGKEYVSASGSVSDEAVKYANVENPVEYAGTTIKWILEQNGIAVKGGVRAGTATGRTKLVTDSSKPLSQILWDLNKWSNNFTAEMVVKTLGAEESGAPGATHKGVAILKRFLDEVGVDPQEYNIVNGSGLSQQNRISANALTQILIYAHRKSKIRADYTSALAVAGIDGTLKNRLRAPALMGNVKAKTGTLNNVSSLAGYMETRSGKSVCFAILVNGGGAGGGGYFTMQEKILQAVYDDY